MALTPLLKVSENDTVWDAQSLAWNRPRGHLEPGNRKHFRNFASGILPTMIRRIDMNAWSGITIVLERPPCYETITYFGTAKSEAKENWVEEQRYTVPLPWTLYVGNFDEFGTMHSLNLFALPTSLDNPYAVEDSMLFLLPLSNYYADGSFCLPSAARATPADSIEEAAELMYSSVWSSEFNRDVVDATLLYYTEREDRGYSVFVPDNNFDKQRKSQAALLNEWSKKSLEEITGESAEVLWIHSDMNALEIFGSNPAGDVEKFIELVARKAQ